MAVLSKIERRLGLSVEDFRSSIKLYMKDITERILDVSKKDNCRSVATALSQLPDISLDSRIKLADVIPYL